MKEVIEGNFQFPKSAKGIHTSVWRWKKNTCMGFGWNFL